MPAPQWRLTPTGPARQLVPQLQAAVSGFETRWPGATPGPTSTFGDPPDRVLATRLRLSGRVAPMDANGYVTFLIIGVTLVLIDGQFISRSGRGYLRKVYEPEAARSMIQLVVGLFYLVVLGLLALISMINIDTGLPVRDVVAKLGVLLLVLAAAHGLTITILMRIRDRRWQEQISDEIIESHYSTGVQGTTVNPVNDADNERNHSAST
jgi:hypothetical protein